MSVHSPVLPIRGPFPPITCPSSGTPSRRRVCSPAFCEASPAGPVSRTELVSTWRRSRARAAHASPTSSPVRLGEPPLVAGGVHRPSPTQEPLSRRRPSQPPAHGGRGELRTRTRDADRHVDTGRAWVAMHPTTGVRWAASKGCVVKGQQKFLVGGQVISTPADRGSPVRRTAEFHVSGQPLSSRGGSPTSGIQFVTCRAPRAASREAAPPRRRPWRLPGAARAPRWSPDGHGGAACRLPRWQSTWASGCRSPRGGCSR
jgi:hypothetical protein